MDERVFPITCIIAVIALFAIPVLFPVTAVRVEESDYRMKDRPTWLAEDWVSEGSGFYMAKKYEQCVEYTTIAIKKDPTYIRGYALGALCYINMGDKGKANQLIEQARAIDPNSEDLARVITIIERGGN